MALHTTCKDQLPSPHAMCLVQLTPAFCNGYALGVTVVQHWCSFLGEQRIHAFYSCKMQLHTCWGKDGDCSAYSWQLQRLAAIGGRERDGAVVDLFRLRLVTVNTSKPPRDWDMWPSLPTAGNCKHLRVDMQMDWASARCRPAAARTSCLQDQAKYILDLAEYVVGKRWTFSSGGWRLSTLQSCRVSRLCASYCRILLGMCWTRGDLSRLQLAAVNTSELLGRWGVGQPTASPEVYVLGKGWTLCTYSWQL